MANILGAQLEFDIMIWTKWKVLGHFVVFSNTRLWEKETNMAVPTRGPEYDDLQNCLNMASHENPLLDNGKIKIDAQG